MTNEEKLKEIKKLYFYILSRQQWPQKPSIKIDREYLYSEEELKKQFASTYLEIDINDQLVLVLNSWEESYHNGDPFSETKRTIPLEDEELAEGAMLFGKRKWGDTESSYSHLLNLIMSSLTTDAVETAAKEIEEIDAERIGTRVARFLRARIDKDLNLDGSRILDEVDFKLKK